MTSTPQTFGALRDSLLTIAADRGIARTDGPSLLALANVMLSHRKPWVRETVALLAIDASASGFVSVPCVALRGERAVLATT